MPKNCEKQTIKSRTCVPLRDVYHCGCLLLWLSTIVVAYFCDYLPLWKSNCETLNPFDHLSLWMSTYLCHSRHTSETGHLCGWLCLLLSTSVSVYFCVCRYSFWLSTSVTIYRSECLPLWLPSHLTLYTSDCTHLWLSTFVTVLFCNCLCLWLSTPVTATPVTVWHLTVSPALFVSAVTNDHA
jgi:hypothetical protein